LLCSKRTYRFRISGIRKLLGQSTKADSSGENDCMHCWQRQIKEEVWKRTVKHVNLKEVDAMDGSKWRKLIRDV